MEKRETRDTVISRDWNHRPWEEGSESSLDGRQGGIVERKSRLSERQE